MMSYRYKRRAFLSSIGGAFALKILLNDFEAMAQGAPPPARYLMSHWPVGTIKYLFLPNGGALPVGVGSISEWSPILQPFATAGLQNDMTLLWGVGSRGTANGGGGHEAGTPMMTTGTSCPGTRDNGGEGDDACAGGPSWDQIFLTEVQDDAATGAVGMMPPGSAFGYANAICDARIDSQETSTRCLSYGYATQSIPSVSPGGTITEHVPLLPELSPYDLWGRIFTGFMPGGPNPGNMEAARRALMQRKSVLDFCLDELAQLKALAPAAEVQKIDMHAEVCRKVEKQLSDLLNGNIVTPGGCVVPERASMALVGGEGSSFDYADPTSGTADDEVHHQIGLLHAQVLLSAMQCDLLRVGSLQWSPGSNHVAFAGQFPGEPNSIYRHHPLSHKINGVPTSTWNDAAPSPSATSNGYNILELITFLANINTWYNARTAEVVKMFKDAEDPFGPAGSKMLDRTIITYTTEVAHQDHARNLKPAFIFGGSGLGMQLGKYVGFQQSRPEVDLFATVAQAFFQTNDPMSKLGHLTFASDPAPIDGLWVKPA